MSFKDGGKKVKSKINYKLLSERGLEENKRLLMDITFKEHVIKRQAEELELWRAIAGGLKAEVKLLSRK